MIRSFPQRPDESTADIDSAALDNELPAFRTLVPPVAAPLRTICGGSPVRRFRSCLCGETGTGKEVLARALHQISARSGPFVAVNCGTLTDGLDGESAVRPRQRRLLGRGSRRRRFRARGGRRHVAARRGRGSERRGAGRAAARAAGARGGAGRPRAPQAIDVRFIATSPRPLDAAVGKDSVPIGSVRAPVRLRSHDDAAARAARGHRAARGDVAAQGGRERRRRPAHRARRRGSSWSAMAGR